jgi:hypothetical protein
MRDRIAELVQRGAEYRRREREWQKRDKEEQLEERRKYDAEANRSPDPRSPYTAPTIALATRSRGFWKLLTTADGEHWIWNALMAALLLIPLAAYVLPQQVGVKEDNASVISGYAFLLTFGGIVVLLVWRSLMKKNT